MMRNGPPLTIPRLAGRIPKLRPIQILAACDRITPVSSIATAIQAGLPVVAFSGRIMHGIANIPIVAANALISSRTLFGANRTSESAPVTIAPTTQIALAIPVSNRCAFGIAATKNDAARITLHTRWRRCSEVQYDGSTLVIPLSSEVAPELNACAPRFIDVDVSGACARINEIAGCSISRVSMQRDTVSCRSALSGNERMRPTACT